MELSGLPVVAITLSTFIYGGQVILFEFKVSIGLLFTMYVSVGQCYFSYSYS